MPYRKLGALASSAGHDYLLFVGRTHTFRLIRSTVMVWSSQAPSCRGRNRNSIQRRSLWPRCLSSFSIPSFCIFTPSFQLSFAAVAGILFVVPHLTKVLFQAASQNAEQQGIDAVKSELIGRMKKAIRPFAAVVFTSLAATLAVTPLILQNFHSFPVYTLFANLLTDLILTVALSLGLVAAVLGTVLPGLAAWILAPAEVCTWLVIEVSSFFANLPFSTIRLSHMGIAQYLLVTGAAFLSYGICGIRPAVDSSPPARYTGHLIIPLAGVERS